MSRPFLRFNVKADVEAFIERNEELIHNYFSDEQDIVEYIDPIACPAIGKGVLYHVLVKFENGAEYWLREDDIAFV